MTSEVMARRGRTRHNGGMSENHTVGEMLRDWRLRRRRSQLDLAVAVPVSQRHLSTVERGRARPSRSMVLRLADALDLPPAARNSLLVAAGFAPDRTERPFADPAMAPVRRAVAALLAAQEPYPALLLDAHWTMLEANRAVAPLLAGVAPALLAPPCNVIRLSLHPDGLAARIVNVREWRAHILARLGTEAERSADAALHALRAEVSAYPLPPGARPWLPPRGGLSDIAIPLVLDTPAGRLSLLSATTVFGTARDITVAGLMVESFFPADAETAEALRRVVSGQD
jgi:transcriptional regulator with XRE-family HTH domain